MAGRFITFEGGEGAGKTTHARLLADALRAAGLDVVETREPGGTPGAEQIRELLIHGEVGRWDAMSEALLHFAARRDHVRRVIQPALAAGKWVLSDRFADSTMAYQGYGHGLGREVIEQLYALTVGALVPDLTVVLDLPIDVGLRRTAKRREKDERYMKLGRNFHERVRSGFSEIVSRNSSRCILLSSDEPIERVSMKIWQIITSRFLEQMNK